MEHGRVDFAVCKPTPHIIKVFFCVSQKCGIAPGKTDKWHALREFSFISNPLYTSLISPLSGPQAEFMDATLQKNCGNLGG